MGRIAIAAIFSVLGFVNNGTAMAESFLQFSENKFVNPSAEIQLCGGDAEGSCDGCKRCCNGSIVFGVDILFMKYHQAGGVKTVDAANIVGNGDSAEFDFEFSPRFSLGYELSSGLGYRINYWHFDESAATNNGGIVSIDTSTLDLEIYRRIDIAACTSVEVSGGYRYLDFEQRDSSGISDTAGTTGSDRTGVDWGLNNWGGTLGTELSHQVCNNRRVFAATRFSILMGDTGLSNAGSLADTTGSGIDHETTMIELALGWESTRCLCNGLTLVYGFSGHWWQWSDTAITADSSGNAELADVGFGGFALRMGLEY